MSQTLLLRQQQYRTPVSDLYWDFATIHRIGGFASVESVATNWPLVARALAHRGLPEREVAAGAIATIAVETASTFEPVREAYYISSSYEVAEEWRRRNLRYYPYYGRGFVQTTWASNYRAGEQELGLPLVDNPDLALRPDVAADLLAIYFRDHGLQAACLRRDWGDVRYRVLGGYDGWTRVANIADRLLAA